MFKNKIKNTSNNLRKQLDAWMEGYAIRLNLVADDILEIGIAGDEKPSGHYKFFGEGNNWTTMDIEAKWKPDIVADITNNNIPSNSYDLVIMTQAIEHIWDYKKALSEIYRITRKYALIDSPFMYPFHQDTQRSRDWSEWDDYRRFTPAGLRKELLEAGFKKVDTNFANEIVLCLAEK